MSNLSKYLNNSINNSNTNNTNNTINESILASVICVGALCYMGKGIMSSQAAGFVKEIGGMALAPFKWPFKFFSGNKDKNSSNDKDSKNDLKELKSLLKKDPDKLTAREKERIQNLSKSLDTSKLLSDNEYDKLENITNKHTNDEHDKYDTKNSNNSNNKFDIDNDIDINDDNDREASFDAMLMIAEKDLENEKDPAIKAKNEAMLNLMSASTYDENGNKIPVEKRADKLKELVGEENWEAFNKDLEDQYNKVKDSKEFKETIDKELKKIDEMSDDDLKKHEDKIKTRAKTTSEAIKKEKEETKKIDDELKELNKDPKANADKIKELNKKKEDINKNSIIGMASPHTVKTVNASNGDKNNNDRASTNTDKPEEKTLSSKERIRKEQKNEINKIHNDHLDALDRLQVENVAKMKKAKSKEELDALQKEFETKSSELRKEYENKINNINDLGDDFKKEFKKANSEYETKSNKLVDDFYKTPGLLKMDKDEFSKLQDKLNNDLKTLEAERDTAIDKAREAAWKKKKNNKSEEPKKDKDGNIVKKEEVTDPKSGKKIEVTTHTGPRGGKFYVAKSGKKIYIKESVKYDNLMLYLLDRLD